MLESVLGEAGNLAVHLPNVLQLTDAVKKAKDWIAKVQAVQVMNIVTLLFLFYLSLFS